ncbi:MAG: iron-sulfur cluster assembly scaffold protein [Promethearchaeota archaeon]
MSKNDFDEFVKNLQKEINEREREIYNDRVIELFHDPKNWGKPANEKITVSNSCKGPCGDTMQFFLKIENGIIVKANFITDGCGASVAAGSQTTLLIEGKPLEYAGNLKPEEINGALGGLPEDHKHCAELSVRTLKNLIEKYKNNEI